MEFVDINVYHGKHYIYIKPGNNLSCNWFGMNWGTISHFIEEKLSSEKAQRQSIIQGIRLSLEGCEWADPTPLLSILLCLVHYQNDYRVKVEISLSYYSEDDSKCSNEEKRFLKFLSTQGFLDIMIEHFTVFYRDSNKKNRETNLIHYVETAQVKKYASYNTDLLFESAEVIKAQIIEIRSDPHKNRIALDIANKLHDTLENSVSLRTFNTLSEQIYNILTELIENVYVHAYPDNDIKRFGLYVRRRSGIMNKNNEKNNASASTSFAAKEAKNCPGLDNQVLYESTAVLELFFVDIGVGFSGSLKDFYIEYLKKNYAYPIQELFYKVLKGERLNKLIPAVSPFGGLSYLCRLMKEANGYIWFNEGSEWISVSCKKMFDDKYKPLFRAIVKLNAPKHPGLSMAFRIPFNDKTSPSGSMATTWWEQPLNHPAYLALQSVEKCISINNALIIDDREDNRILANGSCQDWKKLSWEEIETTVSLQAISLVWFPQKFYSKNFILKAAREIGQHLIHNTSSEKFTLLLADIPSHELISYYYAFNNIKCSNDGLAAFQRIVIISDKWEAVCLEAENMVFINNPVYARNLFMSSMNAPIYGDLAHYAQFLRAYDSYIFWKKVIEHPEEKLYLNARIHWSNNETIDGYLDFDRINLSSDVYPLVKKAVLRLSGCVKGQNVEYHNIDSFMFRACQEANSERIDLDSRPTFKIYAAALIASGYTSGSYLKYESAGYIANLLVHPSYGSKDRDVANKDMAILFTWPGSEFFASVSRDPEEYYRLGKTGLLSDHKQEPLIDTGIAYGNIVRSKGEMYEDFQQQFPQYMKFGHYHTDNHHYLIGFDLSAYFKYSFLRKEGAPLFVIWKLLSFLSAESEYSSLLSSLKNSDWKEVINKHRLPGCKEGALVVYHSNTFTEQLIKLIKDVLPPQIAKRIIPISIINVQFRGAPLAVPPLIIRSIQNELKGYEKKGILYLDSIFSTGRVMMELENILLSTGCSFVDFFSIIDMRRLRNADYKSHSYWKTNIPRLDDDSPCLLCGALKLAASFKDSLEQTCGERIKIWNTNWHCVGISSTIANHGIKAIDYSEAKTVETQNGEKIQIKDSTAMNLLFGESTSEYYSDENTYFFVTNKERQFTPNEKLQLICTQFCLYGNQTSRRMQLSMLSELINNLAILQEENQYTSFASLVLISQSESIVYELLNEILFVNRKRDVLKIKGNLLKSKNLDLTIVIAFFVKQYPTIERLIYGSGDISSPFFKKVYEVLLPDKDLKLLCQEYEGLLVNEHGSAHNTNIQKLLSDHTDTYDKFVRLCNNALLDIRRMHEIIKKIPIYLATSRLKDSELSSKINQAVNLIESHIINDQEKYQQEPTASRFLASNELIKAINDCQALFQEVLLCYFIRNSKETAAYFSQLIASRQEKYGKKFQLNYRASEGKKWYYWNRGIEKEFGFFLDNIEHCEKALVDDVFMFVDVHFEANNLIITIRSWSDQMPAVVEDTFRKKSRLSKVQSVAFDVLFHFDQDEKENGLFLLVTTMSVPACYQELGGNENGK